VNQDGISDLHKPLRMELSIAGTSWKLDMSDSTTPAPEATRFSPESEKKLRDSVLVINIMYALFWLAWFPQLIGVVIAYLRRRAAEGTIWESHFTYAIRTFWIGLVMGIIAIFLHLLVVPLIFVGVWYVIRVVRAFLAWVDGVPIANPKRFW